ncbi:tripartite tricarboxylate transporter substrate binding protein [Sediminispirochaeta smaragdinae]|uniref:Extra-cytoplasmic solute receptor n=1 Tax=Sediminispirochaeta smaragdinae (strain DSM 11293 / JCM 15392 / SEBR 4228) TaxID=573413 RepID=E1RC84_SEDSS|nr:tripartite tricarboxylate transporter substrate binding protein [Sediminispirochaeta smaragdinae]ADK79964.1 conserved hypothetical protein [Sediminispirochaeta smaragdinae DSM 11293]
MKKILLFSLSLFIIVGLSSTFANGDQEKPFPSKPVTILVPFAAGGTADTNARALSAVAEKYLGQPLLIVNKPGGGALVAANEFAYDTKNDGYTLWYGTWSPYILAPHLGLVDYEYDAFQQVCAMTDSPMALTVRSDSPYNSLGDLLTAIKNNPGKIKAGTLGAANSLSLVFTMIGMEAGGEIGKVPYDGGAETVPALLKGDVDVIIQNPAETMEYVEAGSLKYLAIPSLKRSSYFPEIPTFIEEGIDIVNSAYKGFYVPKGTPQERIDILAEAFRQMSQDEKFIEVMERTKQEIVWAPAEDLKKLDDQMRDSFGKAVQAAGLGK